jgi:hypothetical protein
LTGWPDQTRDLLNTLAAITDKKAGFRSLGDPWADTTTPHGRLMLTVLGALAEFERELIRIRTGEGRARAKANGHSLGRKPKLTPHQQREAIQRRDKGESIRQVARRLQCQSAYDFTAHGMNEVRKVRMMKRDDAKRRIIVEWRSWAASNNIINANGNHGYKFFWFIKKEHNELHSWLLSARLVSD